MPAWVQRDIETAAQCPPLNLGNLSGRRGLSNTRLYMPKIQRSKRLISLAIAMAVPLVAANGPKATDSVAREAGGPGSRT